MITGHGGDIYRAARQLGCRPEEIIDASSNVNPLGPPPGLDRHLQERIGIVHVLPEADAEGCCRAFAGRYRIDPEQVFAGNGTTPFIHLLPRALEARRVLIASPTYADYADACRTAGVEIEDFPLDPDSSFAPDLEVLDRRLAGVDLAFVCNPNNPTGVLMPAEQLEGLCRAHPAVRFVVDESYLPFVSGGQGQSMIGRGLPNVIVLNSLSKVFRIPGLRIGFLIAPAHLTAPLQRHRLPWSVNGLAQAAVDFLMSPSPQIDAFLERTVRFTVEESARFAARITAGSDLVVFPSRAIFSLILLPGGLNASAVGERLLRRRLLIRNCANFKGLSERYIRVSLKRPEENDFLAERLMAAADDERRKIR